MLAVRLHVNGAATLHGVKRVPEKRKVGGSTLPLTTPCDGEHGVASIREGYGQSFGVGAGATHTLGSWALE
jgi:hypothetical protein